MVNHDGAARWQRHHPRVGRLDLMFDLKARKQGYIVVVALHPTHVVRHHHRHEGSGLFVNILGIDEDLADVGREVIADGSNHQT